MASSNSRIVTAFQLQQLLEDGEGLPSLWCKKFQEMSLIGLGFFFSFFVCLSVCFLFFKRDIYLF